MYRVILSRQAVKDIEKSKRAGYIAKVKELIAIVTKNPYQAPPAYEKLVGDLQGYYSRRINSQHRFTYQVFPNNKGWVDESGTPYQGIVHILRTWTHYK